MSALLEGVENSQVTRLMLRDNNIKGEQVMLKLQDCTAAVEEIDLSENEIGRHVLSLRFMIEDKKSAYASHDSDCASCTWTGLESATLWP